jgi:hypothetical protein
MHSDHIAQGQHQQKFARMQSPYKLFPVQPRGQITGSSALQAEPSWSRISDRKACLFHEESPTTSQLMLPVPRKYVGADRSHLDLYLFEMLDRGQPCQ